MVVSFGLAKDKPNISTWCQYCFDEAEFIQHGECVFVVRILVLRRRGPWVILSLVRIAFTFFALVIILCFFIYTVFPPLTSFAKFVRLSS